MIPIKILSVDQDDRLLTLNCDTHPHPNQSFDVLPPYVSESLLPGDTLLFSLDNEKWVCVGYELAPRYLWQLELKDNEVRDGVEGYNFICRRPSYEDEEAFVPGHYFSPYTWHRLRKQFLPGAVFGLLTAAKDCLPVSWEGISLLRTAPAFLRVTYVDAGVNSITLRNGVRLDTNTCYGDAENTFFLRDLVVGDVLSVVASRSVEEASSWLNVKVLTRVWRVEWYVDIVEVKTVGRQRTQISRSFKVKWQRKGFTEDGVADVPDYEFPSELVSSMRFGQTYELLSPVDPITGQPTSWKSIKLVETLP